MRHLRSRMPQLHVDTRAAERLFFKSLTPSACARFNAALSGAARAESLQRAGRHAEAERAVRPALRLRWRADSPQLATSALRTFVDALIAQGKLEEAEPYAQEAYDRQLLLLGEKHPKSIEAMVSLASCFMHRNKLVEAERYLGKAALACSDIYGEAHPDSLFTKTALNEIRMARTKPAEANNATFLATFYAPRATV
eukprot:7384835-Prymnesium_polylepis.1